ncbi:MAG TPA: PA domain-containing protein, partial [Thermoanaerobaculia bacterium]
MTRKTLSLLLLLTTFVAGNAFATAKMTIINVDKPGVGFNDTTPAAPIGGNSGTTLGQQRMNVFLKAAEIWGAVLDSEIEIKVQASFAPNTDCTPTQGVLAFAGPARIVANFEGAPMQNVWYPVALANKLAKRDVLTEFPDINASFNSAVGTPTCLTTRPWYLGLDHNEGKASDLLATVLHELGHGLGMTGVTNPDTGEMSRGFPSVFELSALDSQTGLRWDQMSPTQRTVSALNTGRLVWGGESTRGASRAKLQAVPFLQITGAPGISGNYEIQQASFGTVIGPNSSFSAKLVLAVDPADSFGAGVNDACSPLTNLAEMRGNIALVERGPATSADDPNACTFIKKATNAKNAGAIAIVIFDDTRGDSECTLPPMGGDPVDLGIPAVGIRRRDGLPMRDLLRTNASALSASIKTDSSQVLGADANGNVRLYAPCTYDPGSSIHHWDTAASPNLLM